MYRPIYVTEWDGIFHVLAGMPDELVGDYLARCGFLPVEGSHAFSNGHVIISFMGDEEIWSGPGWRLVGRTPERFFVLRRSRPRQLATY